jgi:hypothetical protein
MAPPSSEQQKAFDPNQQRVETGQGQKDEDRTADPHAQRGGEAGPARTDDRGVGDEHEARPRAHGADQDGADDAEQDCDGRHAVLRSREGASRQGPRPRR